MSAPEKDQATRSVYLAAATLSGLSLLGLETLWIRQLSPVLGSTALAASLVLALFFLSSAIGQWLGTRLLCHSPHPNKLYASLEGSAALLAVLLWPVSGWLADWLPAWCAAISLVVPTSLLSAAAMPALLEVALQQAAQRRQPAALLYGLQLLGALSGALLGFFLPFALGLKFGAMLLALPMLTAALLVHRTKRSTSRKAEAETTADKPNHLHKLARFALFASGLLSIALEAMLFLWCRQLLPGSVYTLSAGLMLFLLGLALGSLLASRLRQRASGGELAQLALACTAAAVTLCLLSLYASAQLERIIRLDAQPLWPALGQALFYLTPLFLPGAIAVGLVFPAALELGWPKAHRHGRALGLSFLLNKLGAAAGALLAPFLLYPTLGLYLGTLALAACYAALAAALALFHSRKLAFCVLVPMAGLLTLGLLHEEQPGAKYREGDRILDTYRGPYGRVDVLRTGAGSQQIVVNQLYRLNGTGHSLATQQMQALVPLLLAPKHEEVVTIGMASGITAATLLAIDIGQLAAIELVPEVTQAAREHFADWNQALFEDSRAKVIATDGRHYLSTCEQLADLIVLDLFFPTAEGTASLYSRDFFELCRKRLSDEGLLCLWLPCYQLDEAMGEMILSGFAESFPHAIAVRGNLDAVQPIVGLIGSRVPIDFSESKLAQRLQREDFAAMRYLSPLLSSPEHARLLFIGDLHGATPAFTAPPSTDDKPRFASIGPRPLTARERLNAFQLLNWLGKRFLEGEMPSVAGDQVEALRASLRAGNFVYAGAAAKVSFPNDTRTKERRLQQVKDYLRRAQELAPKIRVSPLELGY